MQNGTNGTVVNGSPGAGHDAAWQARVKGLEDALQEQRRLVFETQLQLASVYACRGWNLLVRCYALRNWLLPIGSRRRSFCDSVLQKTVALAKQLRPARQFGISPRQHARWVRAHEPGQAELAAQRGARFTHAPRISIIVPTYNTAERFLRPMVESVLAQTYANWELCVADGSDAQSPCRALLAGYAEREPRIRLACLPANKGIVGNSNAALALATGQFVAFLDHDDTLAPQALYEIACAVNYTPDADVIYSDEDILSEDGRRRYGPHFKPDWSPDVLRSHNYICHLLVLSRDLVTQVGGFRDGFDGSQDYDLALRATEVARRIVHVPRILYHWRCHAGSTAGNAHSKRYAYDAGRRALQDHLARTARAGEVALGAGMGVYQVTYQHTNRPLVSVIIPSKDSVETLRRCIDSVRSAGYRNTECVIVENHSRDRETFEYYRQVASTTIRVVEWRDRFNYATVNTFGVRHARGEMLLFLNNDVEAISPDWLDRLLDHGMRPEVGAVGAKLLYPDGTIQHAGMILGIHGSVGHSHRYVPGTSHGYGHRLVATQNVSAVTGACLLMRRSVFEEVGGFDEQFAMEFNDVDLCLKVREKGYSVVWTPYARLTHHECKTRGPRDSAAKRVLYEQERALFKAKWDGVLSKGDPFYNVNLTLKDESFSLAG